MPWTPQHRWPAFLLLIALFSLGIAAGVAVTKGGTETGLNPTQERIVGLCVTLASVVCAYLGLDHRMKKAAATVKAELDARMEKARTDIRHDTRGEITPVRLEMMNELPAKVVATINGDLAKVAGLEVQRQLNESPFPTNHEQLTAFVVAIQKAASAPQVVEKLEEVKHVVEETNEVVHKLAGDEIPPPPPREHQL